jgi:hypothetical protein
MAISSWFLKKENIARGVYSRYYFVILTAFVCEPLGAGWEGRICFW